MKGNFNWTNFIRNKTSSPCHPWIKNLFPYQNSDLLKKLKILQCFVVFVEKCNFYSVLPFLKDNIYRVLNIYQMIQICQCFQPSFQSFMKSLLGHISNNLAHDHLTGLDFSAFFTWPLGHKPLCVSIWNSQPAILNVLACSEAVVINR